MDTSFEEWLDLFKNKASELGYHGPIDSDSFKDEWEADKDPNLSAEEFVLEMNS